MSNNPFASRVGGREVARGSVGDPLIFTAKAGDVEAAARGASLPDVDAARDYHTLTPDEIAALLEEYEQHGGLMTGEKCAAVRYVQHETKGGIAMPEISGTRQNRVIILAAGPDATARVRLWRPIPPHGDTKKVIDLSPGDLVQVGIYQFAEDPVEQLLNNREILFFNARDVIRVISAREVNRLYQPEEPAQEVADGR